jgi:hypothetical protein
MKVVDFCLAFLISIFPLVARCEGSRAENDLKEFAGVNFLGTWSQGYLRGGEGHYLEETFLSDGRYCSLLVDLEAGTIEAGVGDWAWDGLDQLDIRYLAIGDGEKRRTGESRLDVKISGSKMIYSLPGALKMPPMKLVASSGTDRWCKTAIAWMNDSGSVK